MRTSLAFLAFCWRRQFFPRNWVIFGFHGTFYNFFGIFLKKHHFFPLMTYLYVIHFDDIFVQVGKPFSFVKQVMLSLQIIFYKTFVKKIIFLKRFTNKTVLQINWNMCKQWLYSWYSISIKIEKYTHILLNFHWFSMYNFSQMSL